MKTAKMSLANVQGKLSRTAMKKIMAGSDGEDMGFCQDQCQTSDDCPQDRSCGGGSCDGITIKRCNRVP